MQYDEQCIEKVPPHLKAILCLGQSSELSHISHYLISTQGHIPVVTMWVLAGLSEVQIPTWLLLHLHPLANSTMMSKLSVQ